MKLLDGIRRIRRNISDKRQQQTFLKQGVTYCQFGKYRLLVPARHSTLKFMTHQPCRDLFIGLIAKYACEKYRDATVVDIGANIGDTAAIIASNAANKLILIEASDFYFDFLQKNCKQFPNKIELVKAFVGTGTREFGELKHWGGTAYFERNGGHRSVTTRRLQDVVDGDVALIKIDTDGFDFMIIRDSLDYLKRTLPAIILENQIRKPADLSESNSIFSDLMTIGYKHFMLWDDPGFFITSVASLDALEDFNRYLYRIWRHEQSAKTIYNYDVLCLKAEDEDIGNSVRDFYRAEFTGNNNLQAG